MDNESLIDYLIEGGSQWVQAQRTRYQALAQPLPLPMIDALERFFGSRTLIRARIAIIPYIEEPDFFPKVRAAGVSINWPEMRGVTYDNVILISQRCIPPPYDMLPLIFHELVHVVQYEVLGIRAFMERYVRGGMTGAGFDYVSIQLEKDVNGLEERYRKNPNVGFSVKDEVLLMLRSRNGV